MALVSTFEVLLKPQLPADLPAPFNDVKNLSRNVIQGYFLTISNLIPNLYEDAHYRRMG